MADETHKLTHNNNTTIGACVIFSVNFAISTPSHGHKLLKFHKHDTTRFFLSSRDDSFFFYAFRVASRRNFSLSHIRHIGGLITTRKIKSSVLMHNRSSFQCHTLLRLTKEIIIFLATIKVFFPLSHRFGCVGWGWLTQFFMISFYSVL